MTRASLPGEVERIGIALGDAPGPEASFGISDIVQVTPEIIEAGIDCPILNTILFWDRLIAASASTARCSDILSEDLAERLTIQGSASGTLFAGRPAARPSSEGRVLFPEGALRSPGQGSIAAA